MKVDDLKLEELLEARADGPLSFAGRRAILLDAVAMGLLRKQLVDLLGPRAGRGVLTRFGFDHGWRTAQGLEHAFAWSDPAEWRRAGGALHTLQGLVRVEPLPAQQEPGGPRGAAIWHESYEAEQHLLHLGLAEEPVCWTLIGFASGYLSHVSGEEIYALETTCVGRGDAYCRMEARRRDEWGESLEDFLPFYEQGCLVAAMNEACTRLQKTDRRLQARRRRAGAPAEAEGVVARSEAMRRSLALATRVAVVESTVLITGESGSGKERLARLIHERSRRTARPWVAVNCGAVAENLIEAELFGHARGAFTGASGERVGLFEAASGGTILLDEVGELPSGTQVKLLRVLQEREVRRLGENKTRPIDVRVLAATNVDLERAVAEGHFRSDLYYRLKVVELHVPPLRERRQDLLPLARALLSEIGERLGVASEGFSAAAADQLLRYPWPGNVRELANAIERALVVSEGPRLEPEDFPEEVRLARGRGASPAAPPTPAAGPGPVRSLAEVEREAILEALEVHQGARAQTAAALGIGVATLYRKLKKLLPPEP